MTHSSGFQGFGYRVVRIPRWAAVLILSGMLLAGLLFTVLAAGLALIALPFVVVAGGIATWFGRRRRAAAYVGASKSAGFSQDPRAKDHGGGDTRIVDAEYEIIDRRDDR